MIGQDVYSHTPPEEAFSVVVLLYFLPVIIIHCYCTKSALTQFGFCNHYVIRVNELMLAA